MAEKWLKYMGNLMKFWSSMKMLIWIYKLRVCVN
jgi:hypothetical protein